MRHIVYSRTDIDGGRVDVSLPVPQPSGEDWRDYRDVAVLAFPTPEGDTGRPLMPESVASDMPELPWMGWLSAVDGTAVNIPPSATASPHWVEVTFPDNEIVRTLELPCVQGFNHAWCFEPGVAVTFKAEVDGAWRELFRTDLPQSSWQDGRPMTLACPELPGGALPKKWSSVNSRLGRISTSLPKARPSRVLRSILHLLTCRIRQIGRAHV